MRLINATDLVRRVLEERDKIRLEVVPRYGFGIPVPDRHGQAMRGGIRKALHQIETSPTIDAVEVVRCPDCHFAEESCLGQYYRYCKHTDMIVMEDDFCSYGIYKMDAEVEG